MSRLALFVVIAALGIGAFQLFNRDASPASAEFQEAPVKAGQGLLAGGTAQMLAINSEGHIYGFGSNHATEVGPIGLEEIPIPKLVSADAHWRYVAAGNNVSLAIDDNGVLWRRPFLNNESAYQRTYARSAESSQAGVEDVGDVIPYVSIDSPLRFRKAMESWGMAIALDDTQRLWAWHESRVNFLRELPGRLAEHAPSRVEVEPMLKWRDFCISDHALLAVDESGALWRLEGKDLAAVRNDYSSPSWTVTLSKVVSRAPPAERVYCQSGSGSVVLLDGNGELWGYGPNAMGELGRGIAGPVNDMITVLAPGRYAEVAVAPGFTLAIHRDGSLWAWGLNTSGQLGIGKETSGVDSPRLVDRSHVWVAVAAGHDFAAGMTSDGELLTWGTNRQGSLGEGGSTPMRDRPLPVFDEQKWGGLAL